MPLTQQTLSVARLLKEKTSEAHLESENLLLPFLKSIRSPQEYVAVLRMFYGFFRPVEELVREYISGSILSDINERRNTKLIIDDLVTFGDHSRPQLSKTLPTINSVPQALGTMYVLEGSTLGGRMIAKMLINLPFLNENNLHFFNGYKEQTGEKWTAFQAAINKFDDHVPAIVIAANETFELFTSWMKQTIANESKN